MEKLIPAEEEVLEKMYEATKEETDALRGKLDKAQEELLPWSAFCKLACMRLCCQGQWPFKLSRRPLACKLLMAGLAFVLLCCSLLCCSHPPSGCPGQKRATKHRATAISSRAR